jgi:hypothetical protein
MRRLGLVVGLAACAAMPCAAAVASDSREEHADVGLSTTARTCHVAVSIYSSDQSLVMGLPATNAHIHTATASSCDRVTGVANASLTTTVVTDEEPVDGVPHTVMTQGCASDASATYYCYTDGDYVYGLQGVRYAANAGFVIRVPAGESFTSIPPGCVGTAASGRTVVCALTASLVTHSLLGA